MLTDFRKIVSDDGNLTKVQQNVFDSFRELQATDFCNIQTFERQDGLVNNTFTIVTPAFQISPGNYLVEVGVAFEIVYSAVPTDIRCNIGVVRAGNVNSDIIEPFQETISRRGGNPLTNILRREFVLQTRGDNFQIKALMNISAGTITSRNVDFSYIKTFRRFI